MPVGLWEQINTPATRDQVVADCTRLIDQQVSAKGGLGGLALKAAYGVVKGVGASYIPSALGRLLPEVCKALDPLWQAGVAAGDPAAHLSQNAAQAADCLLGVTDARMAKSDNGAVKGAYNKLRKSVQGDVEAAVPALAAILATHAQ